MLNIDEIRKRMSDKNIKEVSRRTGVSYSYLCAICSGEKNNPSYQVIKSISDYLELSQ